jgi:hypothetical protein
MNPENNNSELSALQMFCFETIIATLIAKEEQGNSLSPFEKDVQEKSNLILRSLGSSLRSDRNYNANTIRFTPIIDRIRK